MLRNLQLLQKDENTCQFKMQGIYFYSYGFKIQTNLMNSFVVEIFNNTAKGNFHSSR